MTTHLSFHLSNPFLTLLFLALFQSQTSFSALIMSLRNHRSHPQHRRPMFQTNQTTCALFAGTWVGDDSYPLYQYSSCPAIDPQFNCQLSGRPDSDYLKYRWKPLNCQVPSKFMSGSMGLLFVEDEEGGNVMFVGDSLGRNQWESLICMILAGDPQTQTQMNRAMPLSTFKFLVSLIKPSFFFIPLETLVLVNERGKRRKVCAVVTGWKQPILAELYSNFPSIYPNHRFYWTEYGITMSYFRAPYLVDIDVVQGKKIVKLDDIAGNGNAWRMADVLVFNTGHWWTHEGSLQGWDMIQSGGKYYQEMDRLVAMEKGLRTWPNWVDTNVDISRTRVFFQAISPDHYDPSEWSAGATVITTRNCYGETTPMEGTKYTGAYADQTRVLDEVIREMHVPVYLLDITMLSELRKDGHPSIYSGDISPSQRSNPAKSADCSHWCLPGLPDTWNELFYTVLFY